MPQKNTPQKTDIKLLSAALAIIIIISVIIVAYTTFTSPNNEDTPSDYIDDSFQKIEEVTVLTLRYQDTTLEYALSDLHSMKTTTGYGGYRTSFPSITGQGNYTGIAFTDLLKPLTQNLTFYTITVYSEDGYITNYTYDEIMGNVSIYDASNASITEPVSTGGVTMLLAYEFEDLALDVQNDGRFKIAYVDGTDAITSSQYWAKFVEEIQINAE